MDGTKGNNEGRIHGQRETPAEMKAVELRNAVDIKQAIDAIGGHDLLNEETGSGRYQWLHDIPSILAEGGAAIAVQEGDSFVGFVLCDHEGNISQFWSVVGKEFSTLKQAVKKLDADTHIHGLKVRLTNRTNEGERARDAFRAVSFFEKERTEDGEIVMEREV